MSKSILAVCYLILFCALPVTLLANPASGATGFGMSVTGGLGGKVCKVTNLDNGGDGSLRACVNGTGDSSTTINFDVNGTINLEKFIILTSNITIDATGSDITISGVNGFACFGKENIIIRNLKITNIGSGVRLRDECKRVWLDHLYLTKIDDESIAIDQGSTDVTVSWSHIEQTDKAILIGSSHEDTRTKNTRVTLHHNHLAADQRNPNVRYATVHMFNNFVSTYLYEGIIASQEAQVIADSNVLNPDENSNRERQGVLAETHNEGDTTHGFIWSRGNLFQNDAGSGGAGLYQRESKPESFLRNAKDQLINPWFFETAPEAFDIPYEYQVQPADNDLIEIILGSAGASL